MLSFIRNTSTKSMSWSTCFSGCSRECQPRAKHQRPDGVRAPWSLYILFSVSGIDLINIISETNVTFRFLMQDIMLLKETRDRRSVDRKSRDRGLGEADDKTRTFFFVCVNKGQEIHKLYLYVIEGDLDIAVNWILSSSDDK